MLPDLSIHKPSLSHELLQNFFIMAILDNFGFNFCSEDKKYTLERSNSFRPYQSFVRKKLTLIVNTSSNGIEETRAPGT